MFENTTRRRFLQQGALAGLASASPELFAIGKNRSKPNILLIMSDEHNPAMTGCYGNTVVRTPNIDGIAAKGVTFDGHYCNGPLCVPSRMSFTAGKYPSRVNIWGLTDELASDSIPSIAHSVNAAGYDSMLCGKMHYAPHRRYGFTDTGGDLNQFKKTGKGKRMELSHVVDHTPLSGRFKEFAIGERGSTVLHDLKVTKGTVDFLQNRTADKPFFLLAGYLAPHFPLIVPDQFYAPYKDKVAMPDIPPGLIDSMPTNYKALRAGFGMTDVPPEKVKFGRELYYGLTSWVDNQIGMVLSALRANPAIADNTIIIYTSDHGENAGEHGLWWTNAMYESSARVPLVISYPDRWKGGQRRALASSHVDLNKTIVELAGGETPGDWNGDSLVPWLNDEKHAWKDTALAEYYAHNIVHGYVMYREGRWKYTYHGSPGAGMPIQRQLFDLVVDPHELHNLAAQPDQASRIAAMHKKMIKEAGGDPEETEQRSRAQLAKGYSAEYKLEINGAGPDPAEAEG
jgi:choline-sulfatase